jgi:hypothetical protein
VATKDVWVVAEYSQGKVQEVTFEMLYRRRMSTSTAARRANLRSSYEEG